MECLDEIIGLSQTDCECLEEGRPENYNASKSGVFLDRLEGFNINLTTGSDDCANGEIWARMAQAVEDAKTDYRSDLLGCVGRFYKPRFNNFSGQLGQSTFKSNLTLNATHAGIEITPALIKGGYITINKIGVIINQNAPVTVQIYSTEGSSETQQLIYENSTPINATADLVTWASLTTPLELPMWSQNGVEIHYFILMVLNGTFKPKNNKSSCGCGSDSKVKPYQKWLSFHGVYGSNTSDVSDFNNSNDSVLNGIVVNVDLNCKVSEIICSEEHPLDFLNDGNALNMAYAIRFRAGIRLFEAILSSDSINRFTMLNREHVAAKIKEWSEIYMQYISDTCKNTNRLFDNDCLICRDGEGTIVKKGILVTYNNTQHHNRYKR